MENERIMKQDRHIPDTLLTHGSPSGGYEVDDKPNRTRSGKKDSLKGMIGESPPMRHVKLMIEKVAPSKARVLITGSNGTGKELVARCLHLQSPRCGAPFVEVNCAAIPGELIESDLFGHEKGAFTSAIKSNKGKFEQASGGTLFLDEIGDMSLAAQSKVLRALQEHKIVRVGGDREIAVDVRVIAATNKNLQEEILRGNFREDLYHRLNVIAIHVPPLVDRLDDIPLLAEHFMKDICRKYSMPEKRIDKSAIKKMQNMSWSGNVRELQNIIERLVILVDGNNISAEDVSLYAGNEPFIPTMMHSLSASRA